MRALLAALSWFAAAAAIAAPGPDLERARALGSAGDYAAVYELLRPFEATAQADAEFNLLLGEAALRTQRAEQAKALFERSLAAAPASLAARLGLGRAYLALGDYASAKLAFETVLRFDDLPSALQQQAEIYARAAQDYAEGRRVLATGYALVGGGNYRTGTVGGGPFNESFFSARVGGSVNAELADNVALDGSLDYRLRDYAGDRRNDSDLRWNAAVSRSLGEANVIGGVRGRVSYRGNGSYRNDFGVYGDYRARVGEDKQFTLGAEVRQRRYPTGPLRERTRNIVEFTGSFTHALADGKASLSLAAQAGREFNTERADGDANFFGLSPTLSFALAPAVSGFVFAWWQNDRYNIERLGSEGDAIVGIGTRNDNLYEAGGGLTWQFAPKWSLNPEILYIRDSSNVLAANYSSTEVWMTLRADF